MGNTQCICPYSTIHTTIVAGCLHLIETKHQTTVTLPAGVSAGDVIHVRAPDGRLNAIAVPEGMGPGSTFTVEFAPDVPPPPKEEDLTPGVYVPTVFAEPEVETGVPASAPSFGKLDGSAVAQPTTGPYVPAYSAK
jgi:hypothetical protein